MSIFMSKRSSVKKIQTEKNVASNNIEKRKFGVASIY